jgi:thiosulfate dehydrogenase [quinone] large subunit
MADPLGLRTPAPGWSWLFLRIAFGLMYLDMAWQKAPWKGYGWLEGWIRQEIAHPAFGWYAKFLEALVLPNFAVFGTLTFVIEMALGLALLLGLATRAAGLAAFVWQVNIAIGAFNVPGEWYWIWPLLTLPPLGFAIAGAGRVLGLDCWLQPRLGARAERGVGWARVLGLAA